MNLGLIKGMVMASFRHPLPLYWSLMASPMRIMTARTATPHGASLYAFRKMFNIYNYKAH